MMTRIRRHIALLAGLIVIFAVGCATYYQQNLAFQQSFMAGDLTKAASDLDRNAPDRNDRNRLLYLLNKGVVLQMQGEYNASNEVFEEAYLYTQDVRASRGAQMLSLVTNPTVIPYGGEDFEIVMIPWYKAMNYLRLGQTDEALVECRRINQTLLELNDKYATRKNRYQEDAFAQTVMGIIYQAAGEYNDAFIAYRNAWEVYRDEYRPLFGVEAPLQLKSDLIRTARLTGFNEEAREYEQEFGLSPEPLDPEKGELVFFWLNGLGPVKSEWNFNFAVVKGTGQGVAFVSDELGMSFPFMFGGSDEEGSLKDLKIVRVAFPRYVARPPVYTSAELVVDGASFPFQKAEDVTTIAEVTLQDRMVREFATSLLRLALKQAGEEFARKQSDSLGTLLSIFNAATEKADTRNWQTLPSSISYVRVPLPAGTTNLMLNAFDERSGRLATLDFDETVQAGRTVFNLYHTLDTEVPRFGQY